MLPYLEANREAGEGKASEEGVCLSNYPPRIQIRRARRPNVPDLTRAPPPPFSDLFILKELRKRILDLHIPKDIRAELSSVPGLVLGKIKWGSRDGRNFLQGKCIEKSIEGQEKSAGTGIPALRVVYGSLLVRRRSSQRAVCYGLRQAQWQERR